MLSFDVDFDEAVEESSQPEEPLQKGREQHEAHDGDIDNLTQSVIVQLQTDRN